MCSTRAVVINDRTTLVLLWALGLHRDPTPEAIQRRWTVSRATAFRWRTKLCDARAIWAMQQRRPTRAGAHAPDPDAVPLEGLFQ